MLKAFKECPLPVIASVHGVALGGGFELALACDMTIAESSAKPDLVEASLDLHPASVGFSESSNASGQHGKGNRDEGTPLRCGGSCAIA